MPRDLLTEIIIPACHGRALEIRKGQVLRIELTEGKQVGDCAFFNLHDFREWFHVGQTWATNVMLGYGTAKKFKYFYSKPPRDNVMFTVLEDTCGNHFGSCGGRCSGGLHKLRDGATGLRHCQGNLEEALAPWGITGDDIGDCFNVFMNVDVHPDGGFSIHPPTAGKGDYIDLLAEMDILAGVSACPREGAPVNDGVPKSMGLKVFAGL